MARITFKIWLALCAPALAHVSERALVMLLPTHIYIRSGVIAVAATIVLLFMLPPGFFRGIFSSRRLLHQPSPNVSTVTSLLSTLVLFAALYAGVNGSRDPLANPLPLLIWIIWWIALPVVQAFGGDLWKFINPWDGIYRLINPTEIRRLSDRFSYWPAVVLIIAFSLFQITDIAPDDPDRLARVVAGYWAFTLVGMILFGPIWKERAEPFTVMFSLLARLSTFWRNDALNLAFPGTRLISKAPISLGFFVIALLAAGSFDGLNETFWWLAKIGVNPLEFPGRSAVATPNGLGLLLGIALLACAFTLCVWLGLAATEHRDQFKDLLPSLSLSLIPIVLGYHIAHYLTSFLVGIQYSLKAATDPLATGADIFNLGTVYVTTGFFNTPESVQFIWLSQAGAIVIGHMLAVLISHAIALNALKDHKKAIISQLPVAAFMILYTFFGLWILAQPTGG